MIIAVGVNSVGRREGLGMDIGPSEAKPFWTAFLRELRQRGLRGVNLVVSDAHDFAPFASMNANLERPRAPIP